MKSMNELAQKILLVPLSTNEYLYSLLITISNLHAFRAPNLF